jgi:uncharacterized protein
MAEPTADAPRGRKVINGYGDGGFRLAGERVEGSVIVFPDRFVAWPVSGLSGVTAESLADVIAASHEVDVLLLGCGREPPLIEPGLRSILRGHGIALDAMDTGAACRTFNILLTESRAVAAALIAV